MFLSDLNTWIHIWVGFHQFIIPATLYTTYIHCSTLFTIPSSILFLPSRRTSKEPLFSARAGVSAERLDKHVSRSHIFTQTRFRHCRGLLVFAEEGHDLRRDLWVVQLLLGQQTDSTHWPYTGISEQSSFNGRGTDSRFWMTASLVKTDTLLKKGGWGRKKCWFY